MERRSRAEATVRSREQGNSAIDSISNDFVAGDSQLFQIFTLFHLSGSFYIYFFSFEKFEKKKRNN